MFERFSDRCRKVMALANQEAVRRQNEYIGTEHVLLALLNEGGGAAVKALRHLCCDVEQVRSHIERLMKSGASEATGRLPQTPRVKRVIQYAIEAARAMNDGFVGTEHVLLGMLRDEETVAHQSLANVGVTLPMARLAIARISGDQRAEAELSGEPALERLRDELRARPCAATSADRSEAFMVHRTSAGATVAHTCMIHIPVKREDLARDSRLLAADLMLDAAAQLEGVAATLRVRAAASAEA